MINIDKLQALAADRWHDIFGACGLDVRSDKRHSPCPICGGKDRFRCDNKQGRGTWICNHCGAGDGLKLVELQMRDFKAAVDFVASFLGMQSDSKITKQDIKLQQLRSKQRRAEQAKTELAEKTALQLSAADGAKLIVEHAQPADYFDNAYFDKKRIDTHNALTMMQGFEIPTKQGQRQIFGSIVIPVINYKRQLINCQLITESGFKMFLLGGQIIGGFAVMGCIDKASEIAIGEGFATMASVREETSLCSVVAFNAGNLYSACEAVNYINPTAKKIVFADNDHHLIGTPQGNIGLIKASIAANKIGARLVKPPTLRGVSDFNDLALIYGREEITRCMN